MRDSASRWLRAGVVAVAVVAVDQATKALVVSSLERGEQVGLVPGLSLTNVRNTGVAFGALADGGPVLVALIAVALALLVVVFARNAGRAMLWLPVGMVFGGAVGNLVDRAREGAVVDFLDPVAWPAFNLADSAIVVGVIGLIWLLEVRRPRAGAGGPASGAAAR